MLVADAEGPVVAGHCVRRHLGRLVGTEGSRVHEREVRHVEEVVGQQPGVAPGPQGGQLTGHEGRVVRLGHRAQGRDGLVRGHEDDAVCIGHGGGGGELRGGRQHGVGTERRDLDAPTRAVEAPTVVGALQHSLLAVAERQRAMAVRAAVGEGHDGVARAVEDPAALPAG